MPEREPATQRQLILCVGRRACAALAQALAQCGFEVLDAPDARSAGEQLQSREPDLAVVEHGPASASSAALLAELAAARGGRSIPWVAWMERPETAALLDAWELGAVDVVAGGEIALDAERLRFLLRALSAPERATRAVASAECDSLTGLANRQTFLARVEQAMSSGRRGHHAVMCIELDRPMAAAGRLSLDASDVLLVDFARRLRDGLRSSDLLGHHGASGSEPTIARIRSDEFTVLLTGMSRVEDAAKVARRILDIASEPFPIEGQDLFVSLSIGISTHPTERMEAEDLLRSAETAAWSAKQQGRNVVQFFTPSMNARAFERLTLETSLRRALDREELMVWYQPRVEIASGRVVGFEALVRWKHPELGMVSPMQFIPLAEETGLIVPIGEWILHEACSQNRRWQEEGLPRVRMAVNLSSVQFRQPGLYESVHKVLRATGLDPHWLELELTESLLMQNAETAVQTLKRLKESGIALSIDDFGTGYSSLSYLKRFPIDALKIDQSFIRELTVNPDDAAIATSIILMGRSLKLRVVAEGVETQSQLNFLRAMQCDEVQGYLFSPPVPAEDARGILLGAPTIGFAA